MERRRRFAGVEGRKKKVPMIISGGFIHRLAHAILLPYLSRLILHTITILTN